ncbi:hypothetical protein [Donghicola eburneus]|uniref:hypothetical protein n=1 Tax=Donghicola eburneus TaxID=393278 RepID=UPI0008EDA3FC|nr:hypothetical protein [Donghicola eburneus]SFQ52225.1 hypothetical protein SAMN05421764_105106 [Donghicola eburneus]
MCEAQDITAAPDLDAFFDALSRSKVSDETILASWHWLRREFERLAALRGLSHPVVQCALHDFGSMFARDFQDFIAFRPVVTGGATVGLGLNIVFDLEAYRRFAMTAEDRVRGLV